MIKVRWTMSRPPLMPESWYHWQMRGDPPSSIHSPGGGARDNDEVIESLLGWPQGTLAVLRTGFSLKLPRQIGWTEELSKSEAVSKVGSGNGRFGHSLSQPTPVQVAAGVYKRGVAYGGQSGSELQKETLKGIYDIAVIPESRSPIEISDQIWTVVDSRVAAHWPQMFSHVSPFGLTLNEHSKSLASVAKILKAWKDRGEPRRWQIVGGGIISDVAAFAASLVGAEFDLVPTTLLAMVDACVGGKTGVNFPPFGKNQLGAWAFPKEVRVWSMWLSTLPERELRSGAVEALKHAFLLGDLGLAKDLTSHIMKPASGSMHHLLEPLISCKATIIERDPSEEGERAVLNLGHTLGHALEGYALEKSQDEQNILHGEAVAFGLVYALMLSEKVAALPPRSYGDMIAHIQETSGCLSRTHLIRALREPDLTAHHVFEHLLHFMGMDKKNIRGQETRWVLLSDAGKVYRVGEAWTTSVPLSILHATWKQLVTSLPANH